MSDQTPTPDDTAPISGEPSQSATPTNDDADPTDAPTPGRDLAVMPAGSLDERIRYANTLAQAGDLIPRALNDKRTGQPSPGKVLLVIETGAMLGIHPVAALMGVNVIEGKATLSPGLMSGLVRTAGHKLRVRMTGTVRGGDLTATATLVRSDDPDEPFESSWDVHRAARAGLCTYVQEGATWTVRARSDKGKPLPWETYTEAMLKARAIGEVCREGAEDVLMGAKYTPEELGATVNADGEFVEAEILSVTSNAPAEPTAEQIAEQAVARAKAMPDVASVVGVWNALPEKVAVHSWARGYADLMDFAKRTVVAHPYGAVDRPTMFEAFGIIRTRLQGGDGGQGATPPPAGPNGAPAVDDAVDGEIVHDAPAQEATAATEEIHDAEVVAPDEAGGDAVRGTEEDPWATPTTPGLPDDAPSPHDAAARYAMDQLGGDVVSDERGTAAEVRRAEHEAAQIEARREAAETAGRPAPASGAGHAALAAARAKVEQDAAARRAADAAGATRGKGKA